MGRKSQERMTGKTYEERVAARKRFGGIRSFMIRIRRLNKKPPTRFANVSRSGSAEINPRLVGESMKTSDSRSKEIEK